MADPESALDFIWIRIYENSHNADPDADSLPIVSVMIRNLYLKKNQKIIILKAKRNCYKYIRLDHRCSVLLGKVFVMHTGIYFDAFLDPVPYLILKVDPDLRGLSQGKFVRMQIHIPDAITINISTRQADLSVFCACTSHSSKAAWAGFFGWNRSRLSTFQYNKSLNAGAGQNRSGFETPIYTEQMVLIY